MLKHLEMAVWLSSALSALAAVCCLAGRGVADVVVTPQRCDFASATSTLNGDPLPVGTVVEAYDPQGICCGTQTVAVEGVLPYLAVYGDDAFTLLVDEGASEGDTITFKINGVVAIPAAVDSTVWHDKVQRTITLAVHEPAFAYAPDTTAIVGAVYRDTLMAQDGDGDSLRFSILQAPVWLCGPTVLSDTTAYVAGVPDAASDTPVVLEVADGRGAVDTTRYMLHTYVRRQVVINEVLPDPGATGDANRDGQVDDDDEFVEVLNAGTTPVSLRGWRVTDSTGTAFVFPDTLWIAPGEYLVVFGNVEPDRFPGRVLSGSIGDGLDNGADTVYLIDAAESDTLDAVVCSAPPGESQTRFPDGSGDFVAHTLVAADNIPFSPGCPVPLPADIEVAPTLLEFGDLVVHTTASDSFGICNVGEDTLEVVDIHAAAAGPAFAPSDTALSLLGGDCASVTVTFGPTQLTAYADTLTIVNNDSTCRVVVTGTGVAPLYSGPVWYVDAANGDDVRHNGSATYPFATIQHAVDQAAAGDSVKAAAGTYVEQIVVDKPCALAGPSDRSAIVEAVPGSAGQTMIVVISDSVSLSGLTLDGTTWAAQGVWVGGGRDGVRLHNLTVKRAQSVARAPGSGIRVGGDHSPASVYVYGDSVRFWEQGVRADSTSCWVGVDPDAPDSPSGGNWLGLNVRGVGASDGDSVVIRHNTLASNDTALHLAGAFGALRVLDNQIAGGWSASSGTRGLCGVWLQAGGALSWEAHVRGNEIQDVRVGLSVSESTAAPAYTVRDNRLHDADSTAVAFHSAGARNLDASYNWWGTLSWCGYDTVRGIRERSAGPVAYEPWRNADLDIALAKPTETFANAANNPLIEGATGASGHLLGYDEYRLVQDAMNNVNASTVYVAPGTYPEVLDIRKALHLSGPNAGTSPNGGARGPEAVIRSVGSKINRDCECDGATIRGLTFEAPASHTQGGVLLEVEGLAQPDSLTHGDVTIEHNVFNTTLSTPTDSITGLAALVGVNAEGLAVARNRFVTDGADTAITVRGGGSASAPNVLLENVLQHEGLGGGVGIAIRSNADWSASYCRVVGDTIREYDSGVWIADSTAVGCKGVDHAALTGNVVSGCSVGVRLEGMDEAGPGLSDVQLFGNVFLRNGVGIRLAHAGNLDVGTFAVHQNALCGNTTAVENPLSAALNAVCNWWGHVSGPLHADNPGGQGDPVSDYVKYAPWLGDSLGTTPQIFVDAVAFDFGHVYVGDTADTVLGVYNKGGDGLAVWDVDCRQHAAFSVASTAPDTLYASACDSLMAVVRFAPSFAGTFPDTVRIVNNDSEVRIPLTGQATYHTPQIARVRPDWGHWGEVTAVTITGRYFLDQPTPPQVRVGDGLAQVLSASFDTLYTNTPAGVEHGPHDVIVTNWDGQADTVENGFRVVDRPVVAAMVPSSMLRTHPIQAVIAGEGFLDTPPGLAVGLNGWPASVDSIRAPDSVFVTVAAGLPAGDYDVMVVNPDSGRAVLTAGLRVGALGDVNLDLAVNVSDVVRTISLVLRAIWPWPQYDRQAADYNQDGSVNILDVVSIIRHVLGAPKPAGEPAAPAVAKVALPETVNGRHVVRLPVTLESPSRIAGVQLVLGYDPGAFRVGAPQLSTRCAGMRVAARILPSAWEGTEPGGPAGRDASWEEWMMLLYDPLGGSIPAGEGPIVHVPLEKLPACDERRAEIRITQVLLADDRGRSVPVDLSNGASLAGGPVPKAYALIQNHPNPFNPRTVIEYHLPEDADVLLQVYDVTGQCVRRLVDGTMCADYWSVAWDGRDQEGRRVASGIYFYQLRAGGFVATKKMVLLR